MKVKILPPTAQRVFLRTDPLINDEIKKQTARNIEILKCCNEPELTDRIRNLNCEWDTERYLEVNAAALIVISSFLGIKRSRLWFIITGITGIFMFQHALQGWCPLVPFLRKWGVRTADEINSEKYVLKIIRGDFTGIGKETPSMELIDAAEKL
ncbi:MAG: DUF2892 domain-containing protein [Clostridiales bacterium]|nr:DUF2892 domain-containing protein [Clostridiales bacterium]